MDAAEIARLLKMARERDSIDSLIVLDILAELKQAQQDVDIWKGTANAVDCLLVNTRTERDAAQKDAKDARALLGEWVGQLPDTPCGLHLRARIEAMLEQKP